MKIGIVGNYGNNNNGDEAILLGIITQLTTHFDVGTKDIVIFSNNPNQIKERYDIEAYPLYYKKTSTILTLAETAKKTYKVLKGLDVLIIGGGGLLMDLFKREAQLYGTYGLLAHRAGAKVIVYGCGAGPLTTAVGKFFIRRLAKVADSISVRDPQSKELLQSIGVKKDIKVIGDPAFSLTIDESETFSPSIKHVGVSAVPYFNIQYWPVADEAKYQSYVQGMAQNLDCLIEEKDVNITFFSTKFPQDMWVTKDIRNVMIHKDRAAICENQLPPGEILSLCRKQDVIIGTRLHSIILALTSGTPVIGVSYHHKVKHFMGMIGKLDQCVSMSEVSSGKTHFRDIISQMDQNWDMTKLNASKTSQQLRAKSLKGLEQFHMLPKKVKMNG